MLVPRNALGIGRSGAGVICLFMLASCSGERDSSAYSSAELANPASQNCIATGGRLQFEIAGDGAEYGVCVFENNRQCEEWALFRDECPVGGVKVAGYATLAARYCLIRGGRYEVTESGGGSVKEQGLCTLPSGHRCDAEGLFRGQCP